MVFHTFRALAEIRNSMVLDIRLIAGMSYTHILKISTHLRSLRFVGWRNRNTHTLKSACKVLAPHHKCSDDIHKWGKSCLKMVCNSFRTRAQRRRPKREPSGASSWKVDLACARWPSPEANSEIPMWSITVKSGSRLYEMAFGSSPSVEHAYGEN